MAKLNSDTTVGGLKIYTMDKLEQIKEGQSTYIGSAPSSNNYFYIVLTRGDSQVAASQHRNRTIGIIYGRRGNSDHASSGLFLVNCSLAGSVGTGRGCVTFELNNRRADVDGDTGRIVYLTHGGNRYIALKFNSTSHTGFDDLVHLTGISYRPEQMRVLGPDQVSNVVELTNNEARDARLHGCGITVQGSVSSISDERKKREIERLRVGNISSISGYTFTKAGSKRRSAGLIAQEVEQVLADVVTDSGGYKALSYDDFVAFLIEWVNHLKDELRVLKKQLEEQNGTT